ncbi:MAG: EMC3/TMCO1 family protein [Candidatus Thorarchaeota archaeon]
MQDLVTAFLDLIKWAPFAGIFVVSVSVSISTISNLAMRRFADMRRLRRYQAEIKQYQEMKKKADETQNEKLLRKVKRRKAYIDRIQREMMTTRCKPSLIFLIPFMAIFTILRGLYTGADGISQIVVAVLPFNIDKALFGMLSGYGLGVMVPGVGFGLYYWPFYFLAGLGLSSILQRIMGTQIM